MPTYAITPKGIKRWERIDGSFREGKETTQAFYDHLILDRLVKEGYQEFYFPTATTLDRTVHRLVDLKYIEKVDPQYEEEEDKEDWNVILGGREGPVYH